MFEGWSETLGGILAVAGVEGFLGNLDAFYVASDLERSSWQAFLGRWWSEFHDSPVGVARLVPAAFDAEPPLDIGEGNERSQRTKLGLMIGRMRDRQFRLEVQKGTIQVRLVQAGQVDNTGRWRLLPVGSDSRCEVDHPPDCPAQAGPR